MTAWILIMSWAVSAGQTDAAAYPSTYRSYAITTQEFDSLKACQFASIEAKKLAKGLKMVCVPKGEMK
jgi:hypothetical protein